MTTNGWRNGSDPIQRWLRVLTTVVILGVFVYLAVADPVRDLPTVALAVGALLVLLGYEGIMQLPMLKRPGDKDDRRGGDA